MKERKVETEKHQAIGKKFEWAEENSEILEEIKKAITNIPKKKI